MYQFNKKQIALIAASVSVPVMMFFQNCGQAGKISVTDASSQAQAAGVINPEQTSDFLIINPASPEILVAAPQQGSAPAASSDASQASVPPVQQPPSVPSEPSSGVVASHDHTAPVVAQPAPVEPVAPVAPVAPPVEQPGKCKALQISDVLLNVDSISVAASGDETQYKVSFVFVDVDHSISLNKSYLKVKAISSFKAKQIFLKLADAGNQILSSNNQAMDLKIPSGLSAGVKVSLSQEVDVQAGQIFNLQLAINPMDQFVENPEKCIFRPVIQLAQLDLISSPEVQQAAAPVVVAPPVAQPPADADPIAAPPVKAPPVVVAPPVDAAGNDQADCDNDDDDKDHHGHHDKDKKDDDDDKDKNHKDKNHKDDKDDDKEHKDKGHKEHKDKKLKMCKKKDKKEKHHDKKDHDDKDSDDDKKEKDHDDKDSKDKKDSKSKSSHK